MKLSAVNLPVLFLWYHYMQPFEKGKKIQQNRNTTKCYQLLTGGIKSYFIFYNFSKFSNFVK